MLHPKNAELFIGVVARLGVDTKRAANAILTALQEYQYDVVEVKLTETIKELKGYENISPVGAEDKYRRYIDACNEIRASTGQKNIMAQFAIAQISGNRETDRKASKLERRAYIINQLKRKEECELLKSVYGEHYIQISFHAKSDVRERQLADRIADGHVDKPRAEQWAGHAKLLMEQDEAEEDKAFGQRVRDVFPLSDVVIDSSTPKSLRDGLDRFFRALFGDQRVTPTKHEYGMQLANVAALRSSDLSRQVGAAILNATAEIQSLGCNEVPRAHGGTYWEGDGNDAREFQLEKDSNDERKREILLDLASRMQKAGLLLNKYADANSLKEALLDRTDEVISDSQVMDTLEYGRTIHAEMNAITDAARNGHAIRDCVLFCNTFPCHNCAKHIVSSGLSEVIYLRPYPKSYAQQLFSDSIVIEPTNNSSGKVEFRQFVGIVGPIFERLFSKSKWKSDDGTVKSFEKANASFIRRTPIPAYDETEAVLCLELDKLLEASGLKDSDSKAENGEGAATAAL